MGLIVIGIFFAFRLVFPEKEPPISIQGDNNTIIQIIGNELSLSPEEIQSSIHSALSERDRRQLTVNAIDLISPAQRSPGSTVSLPSIFELQPGSIRDAPTREMLDEAQPDEEYLAIDGATIKIRATNLDDNKVGWAGKIRILEKNYRLKMLLPIGIDLQDLRDRSIQGPIKADVIIAYRPNRTNDMVPKLIDVRRIYTQSAEGR